MCVGWVSTNWFCKPIENNLTFSLEIIISVYDDMFHYLHCEDRHTTRSANSENEVYFSETSIANFVYPGLAHLTDWILGRS